MESKISKYFKQIFFNQKQIEDRVKELAKWVDATYANSNDFIIVCLLKGAFPFVAELVKNLTILNKVEFMRVASYHGNTQSHGKLNVVTDLETSITNKDVLVVDEIIDTGLTLASVYALLATRQPNSLRTLALFDKVGARKNDFQVDQVGFEIENVFLVGFGLDFNDYLRTAPFVGEFDQSFIDELSKK